MNISVIICAHNPRLDYFRRVLEALQAQTLPTERWELLVVDNASKEMLTGIWDLSWHPGARHVREVELGLTRSRLRGIKESSGDLLVFVDDDNLLDRDYLEEALRLSEEWPKIGAWGGQARPEFEAKPPPEFARHLDILAIGDVTRESWSNLYGWSSATPFGAGMVIRREVCLRYLETIAADDLRASLDRAGSLLTSSGDTDLAWCALDMGLGNGRFPSLRLTHVIPPRRLTRQYMLALQYGIAFSSQVMLQCRAETQQLSRLRALPIELLRLGRALVSHPPFSRRMLVEAFRGRHRAQKLLRNHKLKGNSLNQGPLDDRRNRAPV